MEFNKIWDAITQCWQVKLLVSFFVTIFTFLVGEIEAPFIALWVLVILDTISKWASVSKITLNQQGGDGGIFYGFYLAWHTGTLNSREMRQKFVPKVFAYFVVIIAGHMVSIILPSIIIAGGDAAQQVADRIDANDPTLPPEALEKTDRTVVVPNTNKTPTSNYDVGIFKVNNYRAWEYSTGYGQHGGDRYIPVQLQRNFSKNAAVSVEYHYGGRDSGWEAKYTRKTDKLFGLF